MWDVNAAVDLFTVCVGLLEKALGIHICSFLPLNDQSDVLSPDFMILLFSELTF